MGQSKLPPSTQDLAAELKNLVGFSLEETVRILRKDGHPIVEAQIDGKMAYFTLTKIRSWEGKKQDVYRPLVDQGYLTTTQRISEEEMMGLIDADYWKKIEQWKRKLSRAAYEPLFS